MNELSVTERERIVGLKGLGWSERRIGRETGHHRLTVRRILREAAAALEPAREPTTEADVSAPNAMPARPIASRSTCDPHRAFIEGEIGKGRNAMAIFCRRRDKVNPVPSL